MSKQTIPLLASAVAALVAGCGSSSDSSSTTSSALTKSEFIKQADAICTKGNQTIDAAQKKAFGNSKPSQSEVTQFLTDTLIPSIQSQITAVKALTPPADDAATVSKALDDSQSALDQAKSDPTQLEQGGGLFAKANQELKAYGLTVCGQS